MLLNNISSVFPELSDIYLIGQGGQKSVYKAQHSVYGEVVLKIVRNETDLNKQRLDREILASHVLSNSPHIPKIFSSDVKTIEGTSSATFILEKYISGMDLREYLKANIIMHKDLILKLIDQILSVLCLAEQHNIVHRDIKPANVMIDNNSNFWLLDFGISRHKDLESLTATMFNWGVGTPGYCPVEQMRNKKQHINSKTDLFSLGILIYECATGHNPFITNNNMTMAEILDNVTRGVIEPLNLEYDSGKKLSEFVSVLTKKNQSQRPDSAKYAAEWFKEVKQSL